MADSDTNGREHLSDYRRAKRRKIGESCGHCRQKKTRCDGQRPECSSCRMKHLHCEYSSQSMIAVPADTLANIESRLQKLESEKGAPDRDCPIHKSEETTAGHLTGNEALDETPTSRFIQSLRRSANPELFIQPLFPNKANQGTISIDEHLLTLPNRATADHFLESYERHVHPLFPIMHMPSVHRTYEQCWNGDFDQSLTRSDRIVIYASMNIIFGLGCLNSTIEPLETIQERASIFYRRARQLTPLDAVDVPNLEIVQYSLLTTVYMLFTKRLNRCHVAIGVAIRTAQTLKLDSVAEKGVNQRTEAMSRRVWHGCMTIER